MDKDKAFRPRLPSRRPFGPKQRQTTNGQQSLPGFAMHHGVWSEEFLEIFGDDFALCRRQAL